MNQPSLVEMVVPAGSLSAAAMEKFVVAQAFKLDARHGDLIRSTLLTRTGR